MYAKIRGTELFFDIDGPGFAAEGPHLNARPVLFLLHGGPGGDHSSFKGTVGRLRDVAQLVYVDHRGAGRSRESDPQTCDLENNIEDLEALRQYLGLDRISILGSSYGGVVAQGYAIRFPKRVSNLVLVATAPSFRFLEEAKRYVAQRGTEAQQRVCQRLWDGTFTSLEQLHEYYREMGPLYSTAFDESEFADSWSRGIRCYEQLNDGFRGFLRHFDYTDQLHQIPCPTLVLAGAHDWICSPEQSRQMAARIPRAHLKVFAQSAHAIAQDEPDAFLSAVRGFLTYAEA